ncbi:MAG: hypothetical protein K9H16_02870 [Bacteroidales bacterium]|nr:hypothetical protein [Bacteroidales bacterium]
MKNQPLFDILFIVFIASIFSLISYFGHSKIISQFAVIFALISYFLGKYVGRLGLRK